MAVALYRYRQLESNTAIRLVLLHPSPSTHDPIVCGIIHADTSAPYEALSYVWGSAALDCSITVASKNAIKHYLPITTALHSALTHLRHTSQVRTIWADGICVEQANMKERNRHVRIMGGIFRNAFRVVVWLGCGDPRINFGFSMLQCLATLASRSTALGCVARSYLQGWLHDAVHPGQVRGKSYAECLQALLQLEWPKRAWTLQEVTFAQCVAYVYGERCLRQEDFNWGIDWCSQIFGRPEGYALRNRAFLHRHWKAELAARLTDISTEQRTRMDIWSDVMLLVIHMRSLHSSDPRDKIFSIYEIIRHSSIACDPPDYTVPIPLLYTQLTISLLQACGDNALSFLEYSIRPSTLEGLPSWAFDWSDTLVPEGLIPSGFPSLMSKPSFRISADQRHLSLRGTVFGQIHGVCKPHSDPVTWSVDSQKLLPTGTFLQRDMMIGIHILVEWCSTVRQSHDRQGNARELTPAFRDLIHMIMDSVNEVSVDDMFVTDEMIEAVLVFVDDAASWRQHAIRESGEARPELDDHAEQALAEHLSAIFNKQALHTETLECLLQIIVLLMNFEQTLAVLDTGYLCLVHKSSRSGDKMALISGLSVCLLLRPQGSQYSIVGRAHVKSAEAGQLWPTDENTLEWLDIV